VRALLARARQPAPSRAAERVVSARDSLARSVGRARTTTMPKKEKAPKKGKNAAVEEDLAEPAAWTCAECGQEHEGEDATAMECVACGEAKPAASAEEDGIDEKFRGIKCGQVLSIETIADKLFACKIDIGLGEGDDDAITIVTNAGNVSEGSRVIVATVGAAIGEDKVQKRTVGGRTSEGMLCDAPMLGWSGGGAGAAALVPDSFPPGAKPPERRPRMDGK